MQPKINKRYNYIKMRLLAWILIQGDRCSHKEEETWTHTEERPCEDTGKRWPFKTEERTQKKSALQKIKSHCSSTPFCSTVMAALENEWVFPEFGCYHEFRSAAVILQKVRRNWWDANSPWQHWTNSGTTYFRTSCKETTSPYCLSCFTCGSSVTQTYKHCSWYIHG